MYTFFENCIESAKPKQKIVEQGYIKLMTQKKKFSRQEISQEKCYFEKANVTETSVLYL